MPDIFELHTSEELLGKWIHYGILDSELTFLLFYTFRYMMSNLPVNLYGMENTWELYQQYWLPFAEVLIGIERTGIKVNKEHLLVSLKGSEEQSH